MSDPDLPAPWIVVGDVVRMASGPTGNLARPHNHFVIATTAGDLLIVPVTSQGLWDPTVVLTPSDLPWLRKRSFVAFRHARIRPRKAFALQATLRRPQGTADDRNLLHRAATPRTLAISHRIALYVPGHLDIMRAAKDFLVAADNPCRP